MLRQDNAAMIELYGSYHGKDQDFSRGLLVSSAGEHCDVVEEAYRAFA
jgi:hypothetical protein